MIQFSPRPSQRSAEKVIYLFATGFKPNTTPGFLSHIKSEGASVLIIEII